MFGYVYLIEDLGDLTVFVDEKSLAVSAHVLFAVHRFFGPYAVFLDNVFVRVSDERIGKIEL